MRLSASLAGFLLVLTAAQAAPLNDLYFGLDMMRNYAEVYWWFRADGRVLYGMPKSGLTPADFDAACKANPSVCGTYTLSGSKLGIQYANGKKEDYTYKPLQGGMQLNYIVYTPVEKFKAGSKLDGTWSRASSSSFATSGSSTATVVAPRWITFKSDGTFSERAVTGIDTTSSVKGASVTSSSNSSGGGTYTLKDNVLTLGRGGKPEAHSIFPVAGGNLNIDGQVFNKGK